jgi:hypothetical protein
MSGGGLFYITNNPSVKIKDFATSLCTREALFSAYIKLACFIVALLYYRPQFYWGYSSLKEPIKKRQDFSCLFKII